MRRFYFKDFIIKILLNKKKLKLFRNYIFKFRFYCLLLKIKFKISLRFKTKKYFLILILHNL